MSEKIQVTIQNCCTCWRSWYKIYNKKWK